MNLLKIIIGLSMILSCAQEEEFSSTSGKKKPPKAVENSSNIEVADSTPPSPPPAPEQAPEIPPAPPLSDEVKLTEVVTKNFAVSTLTEANATVSPDYTEHQFDLELVQEDTERKETLQQATRIPGTIRFDQGHPAINLTQEFRTDVSYGAIDILVVIDNSGSMQEEQANLATKLSSLLTSIDHASWQVGIISTDQNDSCLRAIIKKGDADPSAAFKQAITDAGIYGSGDEKGLLMGKRGLSCQPWLQTDSAIAVLIVSDEDNCSKGCSGNNGVAGSLASYLDSIRPSDQTAVYGIIDVPDAQGRSTCSSAYNVSREYQSEINLTGGVSGSICDASYANTLTAISNKINTLLKKDYVLQEVPVSGSVSVTVGTDAYNDFTLKDKTLTLGGNPPGDKKVTVKYSTRADTIKSSFDLGRSDIAKEKFRVLINGVEQQDQSYTVNQSSLAFVTPPPEAAKIEAYYLLAQPTLATEFILTGTPYNEQVKALIDGKEQKHTFDLSTKTITFDEAPTDGAVITVMYPEKGSKILEYKVMKDADGHQIKSITDVADGTSIKGNFDNGTLTLGPDDVKQGRKLKITTQTMNDSPEIQPVGQALEGSLKAVKTDCPEDPAILSTEKSIQIDCSKADHTTTISYLYEQDRKESFDLGESPKEDSIIRVNVDDTPHQDFKIEGQTLSFKKPLAPGAKVKYIEIRTSQKED